MLIQGSPSILSPMNSPMSVRTSAFSGLGGFGAASGISDTQIADFVTSVLNDSSLTTQQQAASIYVNATAYGVSVDDISRATGYDTSTVNSFLSQRTPYSAPAPSQPVYQQPVLQPVLQPVYQQPVLQPVLQPVYQQPVYQDVIETGYLPNLVLYTQANPDISAIPSDQTINNFVQSVLNDATITMQQQADQIAQAAIANNVSIGDIARATGYDVATVNQFLSIAQPTPTIQPTPNPATYVSPVNTIVNTTAYTPATPVISDTAINDFVQSVLNDGSMTPTEQAKIIAAAASNNNVSVGDISRATGYDVATVTTFLAQAVAHTDPLPTAETNYGTKVVDTFPDKPKTTAPITTDTIKTFVNNVLSDPNTTDIQKATTIANAAIANNVTVEQIATATGYDKTTTLNYLSQAVIDPKAATNSIAYQSYVKAVADQAAAQHLTDQAAATKAQQDAAKAAAAAATLIATQQQALNKAKQDEQLAIIQKQVLDAQVKAAAAAKALADAQKAATVTPTKTNVDLVAKLTKDSATATQNVNTVTSVLKTATTQVDNGQPITVTPAATPTNYLPILLAAGAFLMGQ
jgi:DNA-binding MarR family transcriptional regulator